MGYLTEKLFKQVGRISQERGRTYFFNGAVKRIDGDAWRVNAKVQGSSLYDVRIVFEDDFLDVKCSCPFFDRELETCKHIWAVLLAAERQGLLKGPGSKKSLKIFESFDMDEDDDSEFAGDSGREPRVQRPPAASRKPPGSEWKRFLQSVRGGMASEYRSGDGIEPERQILYLIDAGYTLDAEQLVVEVARRERKMNGDWGKLKSTRLVANEISSLRDAADRRIIAILLGARQELTYGYSSYYYESTPAQFTLPATLWEVVLPLMCGTGRCFLRASASIDERRPLQWDNGAAWELCLDVVPAAGGERYNVTGALRRDACELDVAKPDLLLGGGLVIYDGWIARLEDHDAFGWVALLRRQGEFSFEKEEKERFLEELLQLPHQPRLGLPDELKFEVVSGSPKPRLVIKPGQHRPWQRTRLEGHLSFDYGGELIPAANPARTVYKKDRRQLITRDLEAENAARRRLKQIGFRISSWAKEEIEIAAVHLPKAVRALTEEGWQVEAGGNLYRTATAINMEITSGLDWFDLEGAAKFGDTKVALPRLLRAIKQGEQAVQLEDGTLGIIPEEWMKKYGLLAGLGSHEGEQLRFSRPQAGLLDALLASEPAVRADAIFERVREELRSFAGIKAADPTAAFAGELRAYQREGLGWLHFIQRFGFGGCLADDMGLGKTIQVLALLESRREIRGGGQTDSLRPSLVVVPRSLVFHWRAEAARFTPQLRVLDHTGGGRLKPGDHFDNYDVVLTTYGTLRRDALHFKDQRFDYCILDEAQAIKNAGTLSAKAARLLNANHRLALSGTPVENHLGELWSLFEFLNPGMLGSASIFGNAGRNPDEQTRTVLARALRPFILRRTKKEVARELPPKTEQTIYCDLEGTERKYYNELRDYYRARLLKEGVDGGSGRFKIQVLEALLRLRQAACHPGLIDKSKTAQPSAKIDTLLAQLDQVLEEDHKALVFSQFTSLLAILRSQLDAGKTPYAYLDGRTRDREARVEQFQNDPNVKLFLISLKAGGLGLNLYAAEYVYLLDPWWNPAVEAQAIDRAHRIGQTRQVFAYRLIARDTVEEKVLELQQTKRDLADAIITADNSLMHTLTREDLELLLS
jgi:superfamily II DNA or RNA helicase